MSCQRCKSERVLDISGKCSDLCNYSLNGKEPKGNCHYVPTDMGIGGGDYLEVKVCLDCGQMQGKWPLPKTEFELELEQRENDPFKVGDYVEFEQYGQVIVGLVEEYDRDNMEVSIEVHGIWNQDTNQLGRMPQDRQTWRPMRNVTISQDEVKKTNKEW